MYYLKKSDKMRKIWKKKVLISEKKNLGYDTTTEIEPWFKFPIPKPNFGLTLPTNVTCIDDDVRNLIWKIKWFRKKKISASILIPKLALRFGPRYQDLVSVSHYQPTWPALMMLSGTWFDNMITWCGLSLTSKVKPSQMLLECSSMEKLG